MTYNVTNRYEGVQGSSRTARLDVDITSLANAGNEPFTATDECGVNNAESVGVIDMPNEYHVVYDGANTQLLVTNVSDGLDVVSGETVGTVTITVEGRR